MSNSETEIPFAHGRESSQRTPAENNSTAESRPQSRLGWTWSIWVVFGLMLAFQPNYAWDDGVRSAPYGSDFLQEWIGGRIILDGDADRLYDWDFATSLQHDPAVVGYSRTGDGYYPMVYPPYWYIACSPLAAIPLKWAAPLWLGLITSVWFFGIRWLASSDASLGRAIGRAPQLVVICGPLLLCYGLGQKAGLITLLLLAVAVLLERGQLLKAGLMFGLLAFKPHLALLLGIPLAIRFGVRFAIGSGLMLIGLLGVSYIVHPELLGGYIQVAVENATGDYTSHAGYRLDDAHNWAGLWNRLFGVGAVAQQLTHIWSLLTVGVMAFIAVRRFGKPLQTAEWSVFVAGLILASPHFYGYDLAILLLPTFCLLRDLDDRPQMAIGLGALGWYVLAMLPHMAKGPDMALQWSTIVVALVFVASTAVSFGWDIQGTIDGLAALRKRREISLPAH